MSTITLSKSDPAGVKTDVVVIGVVKLDGGVTLPAGTESLNAAYGGKLVEVLSGLGATGKTGEVTKVPGPKPGKSATLIAVGLGSAPDGALKTEDLRVAGRRRRPGRQDRPVGRASRCRPRTPSASGRSPRAR